MIELTDTFYMVWIVCGVGMFLSFILGKKAGYNKLHFELNDKLFDIALERAKVQVLKAEISKIQDELTEVTDTIEEGKDVT
jgi:hypothetical protein